MSVILEEKQYKSYITDVGNAALSNAFLLGEKVTISQFAVGDGNGQPVTPYPSMTSLVHEVWRGNIADVSVDSQSPNLINIYAVIPASAGPFTIREMAAYTDDGKMIAVANCPDIDKVAADSGAIFDVSVGMQILLDNTGTLNVMVDPTVAIASKKYVDDKFKQLADDLGEHTGDTDIHLSKAFKDNINQNIQNTNNHINDETVHIQDGEREKWNAVIAKAAQNAKDIDSLEITVNDLTGRVGQLENDVYNDVVKYKFTFGFSDLDGVTVTSGNWNKAKKRLEC